MKYALIGCGRISSNHIAAAQNNNLEIVALVDLNRDHSKEKQSKFKLYNKNIHIYTDYIQMLERERPELVAIATESGKHAQIALDCLDYSCNLIIEKPIALSLSDADAIIAKGNEKKFKYTTDWRRKT